jgi:hypothetical protein
LALIHTPSGRLLRYFSGWLPVGRVDNDDFHRAQAVSKVLAKIASIQDQPCASTLRFATDVVISTIIATEWPAAQTEVKQ